jgi:beta-glucanase (GH16 family)
MNRKLNLLIILFSFLSLVANAQNWQLLWAEEFNYTGLPDSTKWTNEVGLIRNNELQYYTKNRIENNWVSNGQLHIIGKKESYKGSNYTSASITTDQQFTCTYGKIEANIKVPIGQGMWPAFWMLGQNIWQIGWPKCGEIDIMEHINSDSVIHGTMHWDNNGHQSFGGTKKCDASQFHVYSIEWDNTMIKWFVDGVKYKEGYTYNNINNTEEFHKPFYLILNLAIGGNWPGSPNAQTNFPDSMMVDYVRVYQKSTAMGTDIQSNNTVAIYPNPIVNHATVKATAEFENGIISITDINGKDVFSCVATYPETPIQIDFLPNGLYLINLSTEKFITRNKFIKE